jgi:hypothetical protein
MRGCRSIADEFDDGGDLRRTNPPTGAKVDESVGWDEAAGSRGQTPVVGVANEGVVSIGTSSCLDVAHHDRPLRQFVWGAVV